MTKGQTKRTELGDSLRELGRDVASFAAAQALLVARVATDRLHKAVDRALERAARGRR